MKTVAEPSMSRSAGPLLRAIVLLVATWSLIAGLALTVSGGGALGVGDEAGRRLAGAHMLVLTPLYLLIAWKPEHYGGLVWVPLFAQAAVFLSVAYSVVTGDTGVTGGILALVVSGVLTGMLGFVWITDQRSAVLERYEADRQGDEDESEDELADL